MIFKIYECDFGIKANGVNYEFTDVVEFQVEDNEKNKLIRGSNGANKIGLAYKEGVKDAKVWTLQIMNMSSDLKSALDGFFADQTRVDVYCISRADGSAKMLKQSVLQNRPQQLKLDDSPDSINVQLVFESYDSSEDHKS